MTFYYDSPTISASRNSQTTTTTELRYHNEPLALKLEGQPLEKAVEIWRESLVKGSIATALKRTTDYHKKEEMTRRLAKDANDGEAKEYFAGIERKQRWKSNTFK